MNLDSRTHWHKLRWLRKGPGAARRSRLQRVRSAPNAEADAQEKEDHGAEGGVRSTFKKEANRGLIGSPKRCAQTYAESDIRRHSAAPLRRFRSGPLQRK